MYPSFHNAQIVLVGGSDVLSLYLKEQGGTKEVSKMGPQTIGQGFMNYDK